MWNKFYKSSALFIHDATWILLPLGRKWFSPQWRISWSVRCILCVWGGGILRAGNIFKVSCATWKFCISAKLNLVIFNHHIYSMKHLRVFRVWNFPNKSFIRIELSIQILILQKFFKMLYNRLWSQEDNFAWNLQPICNCTVCLFHSSGNYFMS